MTIFSCNNLSKKFDKGVLFENISFGMEYGEKVAIIGKNGAGKTTLLNIIAQIEPPDSGSVVFNKNIKFDYLPQDLNFQIYDTPLNFVMSAKAEVYSLLEKYNILCAELSRKYSEEKAKEVQHLTEKIDAINAWNYENEAKIILTKLGITDYYADVTNFSGGQKKRVALAKALLANSELLIMDEPTNHLDADSVQWLQDRLQDSSNSLLFVTHDRYFLDSIATRIIEIDQKKLFFYPGNYEKYLEKKENIISTQEATVEHLLSRLKSELAWLKKGAKARRTKQKSRIDWTENLKKETIRPQEKKIKIELGKQFIGSRVIEAHNISKTIGGKKLFTNFTYVAKPGDRIGIIGPNGSGKSTLLDVLSGEQKPDTGTVKIGASIKIGYFRQEIKDLKDDQSVIGALKEIAEYIDVGIGRDRYLSIRDMLNKFLFPTKQHNALISTLSGGEKRRLALIRVFMNNPNVLLLDEPTNDFDIQTLNALEEYLQDFYGTLIIVSHDRAFLDKTVNFIWAFDGKGEIKEYPGNYSDYLTTIESQNNNIAPIENITIKNTKTPKQKNKLSYIEQLELEQITKEIETLEKEKFEIEQKINSGTTKDYKELETLSIRLDELIKVIDQKTERWLELEEKQERLRSL